MDDLGRDAVNFLVATKYIEAFKGILTEQAGKVVFLPYEATSILGSLGGIRELFQKAAPGAVDGVDGARRATADARLGPVSKVEPPAERSGPG